MAALWYLEDDDNKIVLVLIGGRREWKPNFEEYGHVSSASPGDSRTQIKVCGLFVM